MGRAVTGDGAWRRVGRVKCDVTWAPERAVYVERVKNRVTTPAGQRGVPRKTAKCLV